MAPLPPRTISPYRRPSPAEPHVGTFETGVTQPFLPPVLERLPLVGPVGWDWVPAPEIHAHPYPPQRFLDLPVCIAVNCRCWASYPTAAPGKLLPSRPRAAAQPSPEQKPKPQGKGGPGAARGGGGIDQTSGDPGPLLFLSRVCFPQPIEGIQTVRAGLGGHQGGGTCPCWWPAVEE